MTTLKDWFLNIVCEILIKWIWENIDKDAIEAKFKEIIVEKVKSKLSPDEIVSEIKDGGKWLEDLLGKIF